MCVLGVELSVTEAHMCFSIEASAVRLPLTTVRQQEHLYVNVVSNMAS